MTEDDKKLRECLEDPGEDFDDAVPIYMAPIEVPESPKEGSTQLLSNSTVDFETQVERDIVKALPCKHCGKLPYMQMTVKGKVEDGCVEGCPHNGAELSCGQWIARNRKDT